MPISRKMDKIILLGKGLNYNGWDNIKKLFEKKKIEYDICSDHKLLQNDKYTLGILLGYDKIVPEEYLKKTKYGFFVFHSSNLPKGRGFAPIYYTSVYKQDLVQTLCVAASEVDSGDIIAKARYKLMGYEIENELRMIDDNLTMLMLEATIDSLLAGKTKALPQDHAAATWWKKRQPSDSVIDPEQKVVDIFDHLRGLPQGAPAFFELRGRKFFLHITPASCIEEFDPKKAHIKTWL